MMLKKIISIIMLCCFFILSIELDNFKLTTSNLFAQGNIPTGTPAPKNYWKFDETSSSTAFDSMGNKNGILSSLVTRESGILGSAVHLNGTDGSYVKFDYSIGQFNTNDFTIAFWIKTTDKARLVDLLGNRTASSHGNFFCIRMNSTGNIITEIDQDEQNYISATSSRTGLNDGVWHHVAVTRETNTMKLYIDGILSGQGASAGIADVRSTNPFKLGRSLEGNFGRFSPDASFDELCVYDVALSGDQINNMARLQSPATPSSTPTTHEAGEVPNYDNEFFKLYDKIMNRSSGYFSSEGIPYYSVETLIVEDVDYGHETTSSVLANYLQLEAMYGKLKGDWSGYNKAWAVIEKYAIPKVSEQPGFGDYNPNNCSFYYPEGELTDYPQLINPSIPPSKDPIYAELKSAYGEPQIYGVHSLLDVDNWYNYGNMADPASRVSKINVTGRGPQETIWQRIMIPAWNIYSGKQNLTTLIYKDEANILPNPWFFNTSSVGDANIVKAAYYADKWAFEQNQSSKITTPISGCAKLGDYLRYSLLDRYMKPIGCKSAFDTSDGKSAFHYLISSGYSWGGNVKPNGFSWLKGNDSILQKNQNPLAAYALSNTSTIKPRSSGGQYDWNKSLCRQMEFLQWLQSFEGPIASGCTNSWGYNYITPPSRASNFYGMAYNDAPEVPYPADNKSFLDQCKTIANLTEYYAQTGDEKAYGILEKWVGWVKPQITINAGTNSDFVIPSSLEWAGQPDTWAGSYTGNPNLHASAASYGSDLETAAILSRILFTYTKACKKLSKQDLAAEDLAVKLLDSIIRNYQDDMGFSKEEQRGDYFNIFQSEVFIPKGWISSNGQGATLKNGCRYLDIRPGLKQDVNWNTLLDAYFTGISPRFKYHRFSTQCEIAMAMFSANNYIDPGTPTPPANTPVPTPTADISTPTPFILGDLNDDGVVNMQDVMRIAETFGLVEGEERYNSRCDLNKDKCINICDVMVVASNFGKGIYF